MSASACLRWMIHGSAARTLSQHFLLTREKIREGRAGAADPARLRDAVNNAGGLSIREIVAGRSQRDQE